MTLSPDRRRKKIIGFLEQHEHADFAQLSKLFNVSEMTIRRDIEQLEKAGEVVRVYGGVRLKPGRIYEASIQERLNLNINEKTQIAQKAAELVCDGDVIALDGSTTALELSKQIKDRKNLTVITNNMSIALELSSSPGIQTVLLGGFLRGSSLTLVGALIESSLSSFFIDKAFISSRALNYSAGLTDITVEEGEVKQAMVKKSNKVYVLVDHTKIAKLAFFHVIEKDQIDKIITDQLVQFTEDQKQCLEDFRASGVDVIIA